MSRCLIKVISLSSECRRRDFMRKQLHNKEIDFTFYDAVDFRGSTKELANKYLVEDELSSFKRHLTKTEVGCALSHQLCYLDFLGTNSDALMILEDDVDISGFDFNMLDAVVEKSKSKGVDLIILGYSKIKREELSFYYSVMPVKKVFETEGVSFGRVWRESTCGALAYVLLRSGASKIANDFNNKGQRVSTAADDWVYFKRKVNLNIVHSRPVLALEMFENLDSSIEAERAIVSGSRNKLLDPIRVLRGVFQKLLMNFVKI